MSRPFSTAVIGGGAAGIMAAISAKRIGKDCIILEKMPQLGKKILASGNGRCNLLNEKIDPSKYNPSSRPLVKSIFDRFNKKHIEDFFKSLGLETYPEADGRIFPVTNQSASVLKILELELRRLAIPVELNFCASNISDLKDGFTVTSKAGKNISCRNLVLAGGGKSYPALGSDGSVCEMAQAFGHKVIKPVPAAVPIVMRDQVCHLLQGQKIYAKTVAVIDGKVSCEASGDLLFTKYGLSGTSILDISEEISIAINRNKKKDVVVSVDLVPFMDENKLTGELTKRLASGWHHADLLTGILPNKFASAFKEVLATRNAKDVALAIKKRRFGVVETKGWNEAEFTAGGIDTSQVKETTLGSNIKKGLYFAGEVLDVTGHRGGYNLAWAWASGHVAGLAG